jgi:hypothetical protein
MFGPITFATQVTVEVHWNCVVMAKYGLIVVICTRFQYSEYTAVNMQIQLHRPII